MFLAILSSWFCIIKLLENNEIWKTPTKCVYVWWKSSSFLALNEPISVEGEVVTHVTAQISIKEGSQNQIIQRQKDSLLIHPGKLTWIPKMMVWKRWCLLNMAIFGIYVKFPGVYFLKGPNHYFLPNPSKKWLKFPQIFAAFEKIQLTKWWMIPSRELTYLLPKVLLSRWRSFYPRWDMWSFPGG